MSDEKKPWCYYCRTDSHHDALCWSTRPKHWKPGPEDYEARIAALEKRLAEAGWQPIGTAPVGQRLLFWWSPIGDDKCAQDCVTGSLVYDLDSGERTGEWWNDQTGKYQDIIYLTHWMPLPSPPPENTHD